MKLRLWIKNSSKEFSNIIQTRKMIWLEWRFVYPTEQTQSRRKRMHVNFCHHLRMQGTFSAPCFEFSWVQWFIEGVVNQFIYNLNAFILQIKMKWAKTDTPLSRDELNQKWWKIFCVKLVITLFVTRKIQQILDSSKGCNI